MRRFPCKSWTRWYPADTCGYGSTRKVANITPTTNIIAIAYYWYSRRTKEVVEFDIIFNTQFSWSTAGASATEDMDIQNLATHEFGHPIGLSDP